MKRFLLVIPMILLIILNACHHTPSEAEIAAYLATQTATLWTPTISPTPMYVTERSMLVRDLNAGIEIAEVLNISDQLEHTIGARYQIENVEFLPKDGVATLLEVDVNCDCVLENDCCTSQRTFVIIMIAMSQHRFEILTSVPNTVNNLKVMCIDKNRSSEGISVQWNDVKNFLNDPSNGYQFAFKVTPEP